MGPGLRGRQEDDLQAFALILTRPLSAAVGEQVLYAVSRCCSLDQDTPWPRYSSPDRREPSANRWCGSSVAEGTRCGAPTSSIRPIRSTSGPTSRNTAS